MEGNTSMTLKNPTSAIRRGSVLTRLLGLLALFALIASACGGGEVSSEEPGDTEPTETTDTEPAEAEPAEETPAEEPEEPAEETEPAEEGPALTASFRGVTEDTITIGVTMLDFDDLVEKNLSPNGWGDQILVWQTYIDDLNAKGGINGRMVEALYEFYTPLGTTVAAETCVKLTEDNEVFAVIGGFLGPAETENTCITDTHETILVGGVQSRERLSQSKAPWVQSTSLRDRRLEVFIDLLDQDGRLQDAKVAIIGSIELEDIYEQAEDIIKSKGVEPVLVAINDVPQGDIVAENARWQVLAENIRAAEADAVLIIGSGQAGTRGIFENGLDVEKWVLERNALDNPGENTTAEMIDGSIAPTGLTNDEIYEEAGTQECREIFFAANPDVEDRLPSTYVDGEESWFNPIMSYCRWLRLFTEIATAAGPDLTQESFLAAAEGLTDFSLPGLPFSSLGPGKYDADDSFRLSVFDMTVGEEGELVPVTDILDGTS